MAERTDEIWIPLPLSLRAAGKIMAAMAEEWPGCVVGSDVTERTGDWLLIRRAPQ